MLDARAQRSLQLAVFGDFVAFGLVFPILPLYAKHRGLSPEAIGGLLACYSLAQLLSAPAWGKLSDRIGRRLPLVVALGGTALSSLLIGLADSSWLLFVAVVLNGLSGGSLGVAQAALTDGLSRAERPRALGHIGAAVAAGFVLGPALAALSSSAGISAPFYVAAGIGLVNASASLAGLPVLVPADGQVAEQGSASTRPQLLRALLGLSASVAAFGGFEATFSLLVRRHFGFGVAGAGWSFAALGLVMVVVQGRLIAPLSRLVARRELLGVGAGLFAAGLLVLGVTANQPSLWVALFLVGTGYGVLFPLLNTKVSDLAPARRRGALFGAGQSAMSAARIVGPAMAGALYGGVDPIACYVALAAICLLGTGIGTLGARGPDRAIELARTPSG